MLLGLGSEGCFLQYEQYSCRLRRTFIKALRNSYHPHELKLICYVAKLPTSNNMLFLLKCSPLNSSAQT